MSPRLRLLGSVAAAIGLWSAWILYAPSDPAEPQSQRRARAAPRAAQPAASVERSEAARSLPERGTVTVAALRDPFDGIRVGKRELPKAAALVVAPPQALPPAPPPVPPLQLPYRYLGGYAEKTGLPKVFLALGERVLVAAAGDTVEGGYRLETISASELTFVHAEQDVTLRLGIQGGPR